jgi:hypothetical protein
MALRVLTLLALLGLHSGMGALTGLLHLCQDEMKPRAGCCCGHGAKKGHMPQAGLGERDEVRCCDAPVVRPTTPAALASSESRWELSPRALPPAPPVLAPPPEPESLPDAWVRTAGIRRANAPPLYIQHCTYLI